jgi:hypothetical protein
LFQSVVLAEPSQLMPISREILADR